MVFAPVWPPGVAVRCLPAGAPRAANACRYNRSLPARPGNAPSSGPFVGETATSFAFSASRRLRRKAEFEQVYKHGQRFRMNLYQAVACDNRVGFPRLGLAVGARVARRAVVRNRIRRVAREAFRLRQDLPSVDIVISARPQAAEADRARLRADVEQLLNAIRDRCNSR